MPTIKTKLVKKNIFISAYNEEGHEIGSVRFRFVKEGHYLVDMLLVTDKYRGRGIGTKLMETGLNRCKIVTLKCFPELLSFYQRLDFKIEKEITFPHHNEKGYKMVWKKVT